MVLFDFPRSAAFGKIVPKSKIYEHSKTSSKVKAMFIIQVEKIVWAYKLAPETINLPSTASVPEIQVFRIELKVGELQEEVLRCIDKAIPFPVIFTLCYNDKQKVTAAFKRPNGADATKWVVSDYFESDWFDLNKQRTKLPVALDLSSLYEKLIAPLIPYKGRNDENIVAQVSRISQIQIKERELDKIQVRLRKEKQFNRKVAINAELRKVKQEIQQLTQ